MESRQTFDIATRGRRSGRVRRIEIWYFLIGDDLFITGTPGRRDWRANLAADPRLTVYVIHGDPLEVDGRGEAVIDPVERRTIMEQIIKREPWFADQGHALDDWVAASPLVRVVLTITDPIEV